MLNVKIVTTIAIFHISIIIEWIGNQVRFFSYHHSTIDNWALLHMNFSLYITIYIYIYTYHEIMLIQWSINQQYNDNYGKILHSDKPICKTLMSETNDTEHEASCVLNHFAFKIKCTIKIVHENESLLILYQNYWWFLSVSSKTTTYIIKWWEGWGKNVSGKCLSTTTTKTTLHTLKMLKFVDEPEHAIDFAHWNLLTVA